MITVLSLGQCAFDHSKIQKAFEHLAEIVPVVDTKGAIAFLGEKKFDLVLVNREFDEDGGSGIEFIQDHLPSLKAKGIPVMLVSNYPEAQFRAVELGALPGFGKAEMSHRKMAEIIARLK